MTSSKRENCAISLDKANYHNFSFFFDRFFFVDPLMPSLAQAQDADDQVVALKRHEDAGITHCPPVLTDSCRSTAFEETEIQSHPL
jgi:hypothetical protein